MFSSDPQPTEDGPKELRRSSSLIACEHTAKLMQVGPDFEAPTTANCGLLGEIAQLLAIGYLRHCLRNRWIKASNTKGLPFSSLDFTGDQSVCVEPSHDGDST